MGGVVSRTGALGYELPAAQAQVKHDSNLLPLGELTVGSFQHRALLFKVGLQEYRPRDSLRQYFITS